MPVAFLLVTIGPSLRHPAARAQTPSVEEPEQETLVQEAPEEEGTNADGDLGELNELIEEASRHQASLRQQSEIVQARLGLLHLIRDARTIAQRLETTIEEVSDQDDPDLIRDTERQLEKQELIIRQSWATLDLTNELGEVMEMKREALDEGWMAKIDEFDSLIKLQKTRLVLTERLFQIHRTAPEEGGGEIERELRHAAEQFEIRGELLELERELFWAREEGNTDETEEIESELQSLRRERGMDERGGDALAKSSAPRQPMLLPIKLSDEEIASASAHSFVDDILPKLKDACFECHDSSLASGDLDLERLVATSPLVVHREDWINVIEQLKNRSMPPSDHEQPSDEDRRLLAAALSDAILNFDYATVRSAGFVPVRRLTHDEYNHTVRDLFGADLRPADRFPTDMTASSGFDNSANSLFIQPITLERYIGAARTIVEHVFADKTQDEVTRHPLDTQGLTVAGDERERAMLERFATRAFRRPVTDDELAGLLNHLRALRGEGLDFRSAMRDVVEAILVSPSFLMRIERLETRDNKQAFRINDWELANRLSYFLWASMPDDELFELAKEGTLSNPAELNRQIDRMLSDVRSETIGSIFASQWLGFANLGRVRPGQIDNPWATDSLVKAMQDESAMFFSSLVHDDEPIERLIDADYTFVNEELADYYEIGEVRGQEMRRVLLRPQTPRGGILGQASILAITSFPGRTSPVLRGNWILSQLLGTPPPPPPPNVSEFDEEIAENRRLSQRRKLELHRDNPNCYACHSQIDPLGFTLAKYDWFGRYRPNQRGQKVDDRGEFPDGAAFTGIDGLRKVIVKDRMDDLISHLSRKMLSYALGRQLEYYDEATVQEIIAAVERDDRRFRSLIRAIIRSPTFQMKQLPDSASNPG